MPSGPLCVFTLFLSHLSWLWSFNIGSQCSSAHKVWSSMEKVVWIFKNGRMSSISVPLSTWRCQTKPAVGFFAKGVALLGFCLAVMRQWLWAPNLQHCVSGSGPTAPPNDMGWPYHLISKKVAPFFSQRWCHCDTADANPCLEIQLWPLQDPKEAQWIKPGSKAVIYCNQRSRLHLSQLPQVPSQQTLCSREI